MSKSKNVRRAIERRLKDSWRVEARQFELRPVVGGPCLHCSIMNAARRLVSAGAITPERVHTEIEAAVVHSFAMMEKTGCDSDKLLIDFVRTLPERVARQIAIYGIAGAQVEGRA